MKNKMESPNFISKQTIYNPIPQPTLLYIPILTHFCNALELQSRRKKKIKKRKRKRNVNTPSSTPYPKSMVTHDTIPKEKYYTKKSKFPNSSIQANCNRDKLNNSKTELKHKHLPNKTRHANKPIYLKRNTSMKNQQDPE